MEGKSGVTRGIIDELHFLDNQRDQIDGKNGITRGIIHEIDSLDIQRDQI